MDFEKLSQVTDSFVSPSGRRQTSVSTAPPEVVDYKNPLDELDDKARITDNVVSRPRPQRTPAQVPSPSHQRCFILDKKGIRGIAAMKRDDRRKFLSRLSDSDRRKVLSAIQSVKVLDASYQDKLGVQLTDDLIANCIFDPSEYNLKALETFMSTQDYIDFDPEVLDFINNVINGEFDAQTGDTTVWNNLCDEYDIRSRVVENQSSMSDDGEDEDEELEDEDVEDEDLEDENLEDEEPEEEEPGLDLTEEATDSLKRKATFIARKTFIGRDVRKTVDSINEVVDSFVQDGYDRTQVVDNIWKDYNEAYKEQFEGLDEFFTHAEDFKNHFGSSFEDVLEEKKVVDSLESLFSRIFDADSKLDKVAEGPFFDNNGDEVEEHAENNVLSMLNEALTAFSKGDSEPLQTFVNSNIQEEPELESDIKGGEPAEQASEEPAKEDGDFGDTDEDKDFGDTDEGDKDFGDEDEDFGNTEDKDDDDKVHDSAIQPTVRSLGNAIPDAVELAKSLLAKTPINVLIDTLKPYVPALQAWNFKVTDCDAPNCACCNSTSVIDMPLTHDEYQTLCPPVMPTYINTLTPVSQPPYIDSCEPTENGTLCVNGYQQYIPVGGNTIESITQSLHNADKATWQKIVGSATMPLQDCMHLLAKTSNLNVIDSTFYKNRISQRDWCFDSVPACLTTQGITNPGYLSLCDGEGRTKVSVCGVPYYYYK